MKKIQDYTGINHLVSAHTARDVISQLKENPRDYLKSNGINIANSTMIELLQQQENTLYFIIPAQGNVELNEQLTEGITAAAFSNANSFGCVGSAFSISTVNFGCASTLSSVSSASTIGSASSVSAETLHNKVTHK